ncbi:hypothetical protein J3E68DRAFT_407565 [Trichoderma sp. SZMC 28012]
MNLWLFVKPKRFACFTATISCSILILRFRSSYSPPRMAIQPARSSRIRTGCDESFQFSPILPVGDALFLEHMYLLLWHFLLSTACIIIVLFHLLLSPAFSLRHGMLDSKFWMLNSHSLTSTGSKMCASTEIPG